LRGTITVFVRIFHFRRADKQVNTELVELGAEAFGTPCDQESEPGWI
jgi:hypothetical protein